LHYLRVYSGVGAITPSGIKSTIVAYYSSTQNRPTWEFKRL